MNFGSNRGSCDVNGVEDTFHHTSASTTADIAVGGDGCTQKGPRSKRPKRKVAIIFGYVGERYHGLQWNHLPNHPTVEAELLRALHQTGMISTENYEQEDVQQKLNWERASRTDKGVHALFNVISINLMLPFVKGSTTEYDPEEARRLLMEVLPSDIIVYEIIPVTRSFNAYMFCSARKYEYYLPTFALMTCEEYCRKYFPPAFAPSRPTLAEVGLSDAASICRETVETATVTCDQLGSKRLREDKEGAAMDEVINDCSENTTNIGVDYLCKEAEHENKNEENREQEEPFYGDCKCGNNISQKPNNGLFEKLLVFHTIPEDAMRNMAQYRISSEQLEHVRSIFRIYEGTHSYHNFTPLGQASNPSCMRYIISVTVGDPFIVDPTDFQSTYAVKNWTSSFCHSQAIEKIESMQNADTIAIEEQRERMLRHMLSVYSSACSEERELYACGDNNGNTGGKKSGLEVVKIELHGQSFMLNQIRKMVGAVISMCAAGLPPAYLQDHLLNKNVRCGIPLAPANGLILSYLDFQRYNWRLERIQSEGGNATGKGGVYLERVDGTAVTEFRRKLVGVIVRNEMAGDIMGRWMRSLRHVIRLSYSIELP